MTCPRERGAAAQQQPRVGGAAQGSGLEDRAGQWAGSTYRRQARVGGWAGQAGQGEGGRQGWWARREAPSPACASHVCLCLCVCVCVGGGTSHGTHRALTPLTAALLSPAGPDPAAAQESWPCQARKRLGPRDASGTDFARDASAAASLGSGARRGMLLGSRARPSVRDELCPRRRSSRTEGLVSP